MNKIRILVNIAIICIILILAICFPNIVSSYLQKSLEDKLSFVDVGVKTFEVEYNNIREKIVSINKYSKEYGGELKTVPIVTEITEELKENLTKQVLQQFKKIQEGIVYQFPELDKENLISCEKFAIYSSKEVNGNSFWKLKYQKKEENLQIIMDTEFTYIYAFKLELRSKDTIRIEETIKKCMQKVYYGELLDTWISCICKYFEFDLENLNIFPNVVQKDEPYYSDKNGTLIFYDYKIYDYIEMKKDIVNPNSSSSSNNYDVDVADKIEENSIPIQMRYEYQKKENKLIIDWGLGFFDSMIQL